MKKGYCILLVVLACLMAVSSVFAASSSGGGTTPVGPTPAAGKKAPKPQTDKPGCVQPIHEDEYGSYYYEECDPVPGVSQKIYRFFFSEEARKGFMGSLSEPFKKVVGE